MRGRASGPGLIVDAVMRYLEMPWGVSLTPQKQQYTSRHKNTLSTEKYTLKSFGWTRVYFWARVPCFWVIHGSLLPSATVRRGLVV